MRKTNYFKSSLMILLFFIGLTGAWGQVTIVVDDTATGSSIPSGWEGTNNVTSQSIQQSGYYLLQSSGSTYDYLLSNVYSNLNGAEVTITFEIATYGSGTNSPLKIDMSIDGGSTWTGGSETSPVTPTSSTYINSSVTFSSIASSNVRFRFYDGVSGDKALRLRNIVINSTVDSETPILNSSTFTIDNLNYIEAFGPSIEKSFILSGDNLDGSDVSLTAPSNFEISLSQAGSYSNSLLLNSYTGSDTEVWVRLQSGLNVGSYSGDILIEGGDASNIAINLSGEVSETPQPFDLPYSNPLRTQADIDEAVEYEFSFNGTEFQTSAGGYVRMPLNSNIISPAIDFSQYDEIIVSFDITTFGGNSGQQLGVYVSNDNGATYTLLNTFSAPGNYITFTESIDLSTLNGNFGRIKLEMNGGSNQIRFRDLILDLPAPITWTTSGEWSNGIGPTSTTDDVVIEGTLVTTGDLSAQNLTVASAGSLTVSTGNTLTLAGKIINEAGAANFVVESGANLIQDGTYTANDNEGDITVQRESQDIVRLDYTLWSSPVTGQQLQAFSPMTLPNRIFTYETTGATEATGGAYTETDATSDFNNGKGYLFRAPNDWGTSPAEYEGEFLGVPFNGDLSVPVYANGYTSVGNPYASNIDPELFMAENIDAQSLYFWNNPERVDNGDGTYSYTGTRYVAFTAAGFDNPAYDGNSILIGQGFLVESTASSVTFNNEMRTAEAGIFFKNGNTERHRFWLNLSNESAQTFNHILVSYMSSATNEVDNQIDAKQFGYEGSALYNIIGEEKFSIQGRALPFETSDVVTLGFKAAQAGKFNISLSNFDGLFAEDEIVVYLRDNELNITHNLSESAYTFESSAGEFNTRFEVVYETQEVMGTADLTANSVQIYTHNQQIVVSSKSEKILSVELFDLSGRNIHTNNNVNANTYQIKSASKGVLVVRVQTQDGEIITKKLINK